MLGLTSGLWFSICFSIVSIINVVIELINEIFRIICGQGLCLTGLGGKYYFTKVAFAKKLLCESNDIKPLHSQLCRNIALVREYFYSTKLSVYRAYCLGSNMYFCLER